MRVRWTLLALSQLDAIQDYIAEDNPLAAFEVTTGIFGRVETDLPNHPYIGRIGEHFPDTRELLISNPLVSWSTAPERKKASLRFCAFATLTSYGR